MNGHRLFNFTPLAPIYEGSFEGHHSGNVMCSSNLFPFNNFRTHVRDRNALNPFRFMHLRTTFIATEGGGVLSLTTNHSPRLTLFSFQQVTTVNFCNSSVLITIRIAGGGGRGSSRNQQHTSCSTSRRHGRRRKAERRAERSVQRTTRYDEIRLLTDG